MNVFPRKKHVSVILFRENAILIFEIPHQTREMDVAWRVCCFSFKQKAIETEIGAFDGRCCSKLSDKVT